mgnify:CR=1 FL=1
MGSVAFTSNTSTPQADVTSRSDVHASHNNGTNSETTIQNAASTAQELVDDNDTEITAGVQCRLTGLNRRRDLNGRKCVVLGKSKRKPQKWVVEFVENKKQVEIGAHNLKKLPTTNDNQRNVPKSENNAKADTPNLRETVTSDATTSSADAIEPGCQCVMRGLKRRQDLNNVGCVVVKKSPTKANKWVVKVISQNKHVEIGEQHLEMVKYNATVPNVVDEPTATAPPKVASNRDDTNTSSVNGETIFERLQDVIADASAEQLQEWQQQIDALEDADYKKGCASQGISRPLLTQLSSFVSTHHPNWTTYDFCDQYIKPITAQFKCSFLNLLQVVLLPTDVPATTTGVCAQATIFVSHAWKYPNHRLLSCLVALEKSVEKEDFFWIDTLTVTQHERPGKPERGFDWWCDTFLEAIKLIGRTALVLQPYSNPEPLRRSWCLFEIFCTHKAGVKLDIVLDKNEQVQFESALLDGSFDMDDWASEIDLATAKAKFTVDEQNILAQVNSFGGGVQRLNEVVIDLLRDWFARTARETTAKLSQSSVSDNETWVTGVATQGNTATLLHEQGNLKEAEVLYRQALETTRVKLGDTHPTTLRSMINLANLLDDKRELREAEQLSRTVVAAREEQLGGRHKDTLNAINILANILENQNKYVEAETLYRQVMNGQTVTLGADHRDTLFTMNNLADILRKQKKFVEAEKLFGTVLAANKVQFGEDHPSTLETMANYASLLVNQDRFAEAEVLQRKVLTAFRAKKGQHHQTSMLILNNLALTLERQGKLNEAEQLYRQSLTAMQRKFGAGHPHSLEVLQNLGVLQMNQEKWSEAEETLRQAQDGFLKLYGATDQNTVKATIALAQALMQQGKLQEALNLLQQLRGE